MNVKEVNPTPLTFPRTSAITGYESFCNFITFHMLNLFTLFPCSKLGIRFLKLKITAAALANCFGDK